MFLIHRNLFATTEISIRKNSNDKVMIHVIGETLIKCGAIYIRNEKGTPVKSRKKKRSETENESNCRMIRFDSIRLNPNLIGSNCDFEEVSRIELNRI